MYTEEKSVVMQATAYRSDQLWHYC